MSRLRFKGGAWTNSEDEVLLASLTVYGLKNWERVASMLVRKTAAQCRERWENFLDPHLNIREAWTVGEEEQLVQLQALFPNQWTLIAQEIWHRCGMKRPAWLCEEHYHLLLDALEYERHQQTDGSKSALTLEDFLEERKRQRSVHQGHETRAARPDAVNAEVFEREMVEFAVSRLANQDGKKGLRKERKKQLEHTSFLAKLQSNREAIESGTLSAKARKRMEKAMMEDRQGPSGSRLLDSIAEESEEGVEDSGKEHSGNFQPINLGADKEAAGIETKQRTLVKRFKSTPSLDPVQSQLQDAKSVGIDLELLRAAGSVSSTVKKSLGPPNDLSLLTAGGDASVNDHQNMDLDSIFAQLPEHEPLTKKSDRRFDDAILRTTKERVAIEAERMFLSRKRRRYESAEQLNCITSIALDGKGAPEQQNGQPSDVSSDSVSDGAAVLKEGGDVVNSNCMDETSRLVHALVRNQMDAAAQYLASEEDLYSASTDGRAGDYVSLGDAVGEVSLKSALSGNKEHFKFSVCTTAASGEDNNEFWRDVSSTVAAVELENRLRNQKERFNAAVKHAREVVLGKRGCSERIIRICFPTRHNVMQSSEVTCGGGSHMNDCDDVASTRFIRNACVYWAMQLQDAQRQLAFYMSVREEEKREIQRRLDGASKRLLEVEEKERTLQKLYRANVTRQ
uniref:Cell division control protein n=1 Tax=Trypanosoma vivax (strain Y486) TaxID=1055687 RepID=G0TVH4_TRYVY|nr:conserved hypothetical protein [Trypanosoma vivax Y486]